MAKKFKLLNIDTSTNRLSVALSCGHDIVASREFVLKNVLSSSIIPTINQVFKKADLSLAKVDGLATGLGPGSFTGLRVGLATIKALAFASNKPIIGLSSLDLIAANILKEAQKICVVCDARRSLVFGAFYKRKGSALSRKGKYLLTSVENLLSKTEKGTIFVGDGVPMVEEYLGSKKAKESRGAMSFAENCTFENDNRLWIPKAKNLTPLVYDQFVNKKFQDVNKLVPLYLYPEDCQVRKSKKVI